MWKPYKSFPQNGKQYIVWNGISMAILNKPKGHALGTWVKIGNKWYGSFNRFNNPTHWRELPTPPTI